VTQEAELTECQASLRDGECIHPRCPMNGGCRDLTGCPLPWSRMQEYIEEEL
jgi:hypothetical protein